MYIMYINVDINHEVHVYYDKGMVYYVWVVLDKEHIYEMDRSDYEHTGVSMKLKKNLHWNVC